MVGGAALVIVLIGLAFALLIGAFIGGLILQAACQFLGVRPPPLGRAAGIVLIAVAYYWFYSRHHLVANAPEEEFAAIAKAEAELD